VERKDTIVAIATALTDSGIGIIRLSGEESVSIVNRIFLTKSGKRILSTVKSHTIHYGFLVDYNYISEINEDNFKNYLIDEVMVSVMKAPKSYTMEDTVEINCHGGVLVMKKVLEAVLNAGARMAEPGEFTKRAFLNGRIDLSQAEAVIDVIHSQNELALKSSVNQLKGDLAKKIRELREAVLYEIAFIESALDDPEHISLEGYPNRLSEKIIFLKKDIKQLLESAENGRIIKEGISTVIVGKPNAGKSSLLNYILGEDRAIVTDIAGTTRDILQENIRLGDISLNMIDTAGIRDTQDPVEKIGVEKAKKYVEDADLLLYVVDSSVPLDQNDFDILKILQNKKSIVLMNKSDLNQVVEEKMIMDYLKDSVSDISILHTSTTNKEGLDAFEKTVHQMFFRGDIKQDNQMMIINIRHKEALQVAYDSLSLVERTIQDDMPEDFYSIDLMSAYTSLGTIIGEEVEDDLVEEIFSKFCMGK